MQLPQKQVKLIKLTAPTEDSAQQSFVLSNHIA